VNATREILEEEMQTVETKRKKNETKVIAFISYHVDCHVMNIRAEIDSKGRARAPFTRGEMRTRHDLGQTG
jgi:hypothetical protein